MDLPPFSFWVEFAQPYWLLVMVMVPVLALLGARSMSGLGAVRQGMAIALRCMVVLLVAAALAEPQWLKTIDHQTVVFAIDQSDSIPAALRDEALGFLKASTKAMRAGKDAIAGILFAGRPTIWQVPKPALAGDRLPEVLNRHQTDIASAMRMALMMFPAETAKRLVLISDGRESVAGAVETAQSYAALGVPIDVLLLPYERKAEILVDRLSAPARANRDEVIDLQFFVAAQRAAGAYVQLYDNDVAVDLDAQSPNAGIHIRLDQGMNRLTIPMTMTQEGLHRFHVIVQPTDPGADTITANNEGRAFTTVGRAERVVILSEEDAGRGGVGKDALWLGRTLREGGLDVATMTVSQLAGDASTLTDCSTLILSNVSALTLGTERLEMFRSFVRDQGGGLIVVGGDRSFSVGGYGGTTLEEILPVETSRDKLKLLSLSLVLVIDRSGSMNGLSIAMARSAAVGAIQMLTSLERVGVIAFADSFEWVVAMRAVDHKARIAQQIESIGSGGGTSIFPALEEAYAAQLREKTNLKHIILLTDGQSAGGDFDELAEKCRESAITVSTVAVGPGADRSLLSRIAERSSGRMYVAESAQQLPQIFTQEAILASRSGLFEGTFQPLLQADASERIMVGFSAADIPTLAGHVVTIGKEAASVPLVRVTEEGVDPILAYWQVGLGRVVAFTSGQWSTWGAVWADWSGAGKLLLQAVRYAGRVAASEDIAVETRIAGGRGNVVVSADNLSRPQLASLVVSARLVDPKFAGHALPLRRVGLDRFEGEFAADDPGNYLVQVSYRVGSGENAQSGTARAATAVSYPREYATLRHDEAVLTEIARRTGGRVLSAAHPTTVFEPWSIRPVVVREPVWELLLMVALGLFLLDVAVRRIAVSPQDVWHKMESWFTGHSVRGPGQSMAQTLVSFRGAQRRTQEFERHGTSWSGSRWDGSTIEGDETPLPPVAGDGEVIRTEPSRADTANQEEEGDYTSRLLRAKGRAKRIDGTGD